MGIPDSQLTTWSNRGAVQTAEATRESIYAALTADTSLIKDKNFEAYLQGSYRNYTNIRGDSDVDVIVQLNTTFNSNTSSLSEPERELFNKKYPDATYLWEHFRSDVLQSLRDHYVTSTITEGDKSVKLGGSTGRLPADIVICLQHRKYMSFSLDNEKFVDGISFYTRSEGRKIINFPKLHYNNGVTKNSETNNWFKPTVRVFKNVRTYMVDNNLIDGTLAPSYFLECLIYNVPANKFGGSYQNTLVNTVNWLSGVSLDNFKCQNGQHSLFGNTPEQWEIGKANEFISKLITLWNGW